MNPRKTDPSGSSQEARFKEEIKRLKARNRSLEKKIQSLEHLEKRFSVLFHEAIDALVVLDGDSARIIQANKSAGQLLKYAEKDLMGIPFTRLLVSDSDLPVPRSEDDIRHYNTVFVQTFRLADGSECDMDLTFTMIPWDDKAAILMSFRDVSERIQAEKEREKLIRELQEAMEKIKTLRGLIPICAHCKKIRDDEGYWQQVDVYVRDHTQAQFSHGICPECMHSLYPELFNEEKSE